MGQGCGSYNTTSKSVMLCILDVIIRKMLIKLLDLSYSLKKVLKILVLRLKKVLILSIELSIVNAYRRSCCILRSFYNKTTDFMVNMFKTYVRPLLECSGSSTGRGQGGAEVPSFMQRPPPQFFSKK